MSEGLDTAVMTLVYAGVLLAFAAVLVKYALFANESGNAGDVYSVACNQFLLVLALSWFLPHYGKLEGSEWWATFFTILAVGGGAIVVGTTQARAAAFTRTGKRLEGAEVVRIASRLARKYLGIALCLGLLIVWMLSLVELNRIVVPRVPGILGYAVVVLGSGVVVIAGNLAILWAFKYLRPFED